MNDKALDSLSSPLEFHPQLHSSKMQPTSIEAYRKILENGLLTKARMRVYCWVASQPGPVTGREADVGTGDPNAHTRLSELVRLGVAEEVGSKVCSVTGIESLARDLTWNLPSGVVRDGRPSTKDSEAKAPTKAQVRRARADLFEMGRVATRNGFKFRYVEAVRVVFEHLEAMAGDDGAKCPSCDKRLARTYDGMWCPKHGLIS